MKKIGFIGGYDKADLIMYIANILAKLQKRVLVLDTTTLQKTKYTIPTIEPTTSYLIEFENFDVAVGFKNLQKISEYLGEEPQYDIVLIDIDSAQLVKENFIANVDQNYFVTAFDMYSLKKGMEILDGLAEPLKLTRILFNIEHKKEDEEYLNYLSLGKKVIWNDEIIYFLQGNGDSVSITNNQRLGKIKFGNLSNTFKENIVFIVQQILGEHNNKAIKNVIKNSE